MLTENDRRTYFDANPILESFLSTMLQDLQYSEADEACMEDREEEDNGTIYTVRDETFLGAVAYCSAFMRDNAEHVTAADDLVPGEAGLRYTNDRYMNPERVGSTLYLACVGHGVGFTDDGDAPCLKSMEAWARVNRCEAYQSGADVYFIRYSA